MAEQHCEEYRKMSEVNEQSLRELNETCDEFKTKMSEDLERMKVRKSLYCCSDLPCTCE